MNYKVLTLYQPFATLLVHGAKKIETRPSPTSWVTHGIKPEPENKKVYLIHAAKKWTRVQEYLCTYDMYFRNELNNIFPGMIKIGHPLWKNYFKFGGIIGSVEVKECIQIYQITEHLDHFVMSSNTVIDRKEYAFGEYKQGRYMWICENPRILKEPMLYRGGQGYYQNFHGDESKLIFK